MGEYKKLDDLDIYQISRQTSKAAWQIYLEMPVDQKIIIGQQFVKAIDSICANISEGYGRYYYLEKVRFYYIARASLFESITWLELLRERQIIDNNIYNSIKNNLDNLHIKLNSYIRFTKDTKNSNPNKPITK
jgi:four helix bundle protein